MKVEYSRVTDYRQLYDYYQKIKTFVPYWLDADYELWLDSFVSDTDYDGEEMFSELIAYTAQSEGEIIGFVQFGISRYVYGTDGNKDFNTKGGIIRNLYFGKDSDCGNELVSIALKYFDVHNIEKRFAFFHAFGMTCNACHGKLFCALTHIEEVLSVFGFVREHENVYYKRMLTEADVFPNSRTTVVFRDKNEKGLCEFTILYDGKFAGAGALVYLPQGDMCYLKWIYIEGSMQRRGLATAALKAIFSGLYRSGIRRIDTDTADVNLIAQRLYTKTGFEDMGRTRSYLI